MLSAVFDPRILESYNQNLIRIAGAARYEMRQYSPEVLKSKLLNEGFKEGFVDMIIDLAQT